MDFPCLLFTKTVLLILVAVVCVYSECPLGWVHYNNKCFHFSSDKLDWYTAETSCHHHNGKLAEPVSKEETDYLLLMANIFGKEAHYWLGGRDDVIEGVWQWSSSDDVIKYLPWWQNQPDNAFGNEDCLDISCIASSAKCLFNDERCYLKMSYICERSYPGWGTVIG